MNQEQQLLIDSFIDNTIDAAQLQELKRLLAADPDLRKAMATELRLRGLIYCAQQPGQLADRVDRAIQDLSIDLDEEQILRTIETIDPKPHWSRNLLLWSWVAIAAQLLIIPGLWFYTMPKPELPKQIAQVRSQIGVTFLVRGKSKLMMKVGDPIYSGDRIYVEHRSETKLEYLDATRLNLLENSFVEVTESANGKKLYLFAGLLQMKVTPQPKGSPLELITEHSHSIVRGTEFEMNSSDISTLLEVKEGKIEVVPMTTGAAPSTVLARHFAISTAGAPNIVRSLDVPIAVSPLITKATPGRQANLTADLKGATKLYLVVTNGGDNNRYDHAVWIAPRLTGPKGELDLTTLEWKIAKAGYYKPSNNCGLYGEPPSINGTFIPRCIATHATSVIEYDLPPGYDRFESIVGLLDSGSKAPESCASVTFEVYSSLPEDKLKSLLIRRAFY
jgi:ferric-dicitrate binding protein FerR (iron transport regulator)